MTQPVKHLVHVSGGLASCEALRRTIAEQGKENVIPVFADVQGDPARDAHAAPAGSGWDGEDTDVYRFLRDLERLFDIPIHRAAHPSGLGVWGAIFRERAITIQLPSGLTFAPCTKMLKQETLDAFTTALPFPVVNVLGLGWAEQHRIDKYLARRDASADFPMSRPPYVDNCHIAAYLEANGVRPPVSYSQGYPHANCGGACVKAGIAQWAKLYGFDLGRFLYNEDQETLFRAEVNPNVAILTETVNGEKRPLPLSVLRARLESGDTSYDRFAWGGCGCFAEIPQLRMEGIVLEANAPRKATA